MSAQFDLVVAVWGNPELFFAQARSGDLPVERFYAPTANEQAPFIVTNVDLRAKGQESGITVHLPHSQLFWFVNGRCELHRMYLNRTEGFEAAGLEVPES